MQGFGYTLLSSLIALVGSMILGTAFAIIQIVPKKWVRKVGNVYAQVFRNIPLLIITFFLQFFPELIKEGHLYILQTPLFRVRNKKETRYCYSEPERIKALEEVKNPEITRFKGLGEISPDEFKHFIGKDIRLEPVMIGKDQTIESLLEFYMGKNTPTRQEFIINNLAIESIKN